MNTKSKIGNFTIIFLVGTAALIDGLQFLLTLTVLGSILSSFVTILASIGFFIFFLLLGVKYTGKGGGVKLFTMLSTSIVELVPFLGAIPAWTAGVTAIIIQERIKEAKERLETNTDPKKLAAIARLARMKAARSTLMESGRIARQAKELNRRPAESSQEES